MSRSPFTIRPCVEADSETLANLVHELAVYEKLGPSRQRPRPTTSAAHLFGPKAGGPGDRGRDLRARWLASRLFFPTFSTFRGQPGLYLEDLYVRPAHRGGGIGKAAAGLGGETGGRGWVAVGSENGRCSTGTRPAIAFYQSRPEPDRWSEWNVYRIDDEPLARLADLAPESPGERSRVSRFFLPHIAQDGGLSTRRATTLRRHVHQAEHEREPVSAFPQSGRGDRALPRRRLAEVSRPDGHGLSRGRRASPRRLARDDPGRERFRRPLDDHHPRASLDPGDVIVRSDTPSYILYKTLAELQDARFVEVPVSSQDLDSRLRCVRGQRGAACLPRDSE